MPGTVCVDSGWLGLCVQSWVGELGVATGHVVGVGSKAFECRSGMHVGLSVRMSGGGVCQVGA